MSGRTFDVGPGEWGLTSPHQKCDGKRPCTACVIGEDGTRCTYEPRQRSSRISTNALSVSRDSASGPQRVCSLPSETAADGFSFSEPPTHLSSNIPLLTWSNSSNSASSLSPSPPLVPYERPLAPSSRGLGKTEPGLSLDVSVVQNIHITAECAPRSTAAYFTVLPSIHFQIIPRPLRVPLSLIPPERVQISPIAECDLDMTLYVLPRFPTSHRD